MNKTQQIEELANCKFCYQNVGRCPVKDKNHCFDYTRAVMQYERGYRVVPDGAVVLTPEERDEEMKEINKTLAERDELKAENERLKEVIADQNELCWNCKKSVKEFAEKMKETALSHCRTINCYELTFIETTIDDLVAAEVEAIDNVHSIPELLEVEE